ncbi:MAG: phosphodiesterase [Leptolyngbya sp. SIO1D8]|nr:phosphodiesterase [Leptolyngbya sp. SIO1D8]
MLENEPVTVYLCSRIAYDEYSSALAILSKLTMPYFVIPGNHDHREHFRTAFANQHYLPTTEALHYCVDDYPVRIIGLDSCLPNWHHGHIDAMGLRWLQFTLEQDPNKLTLVMMHHPPFVSGIPYMDDYRCRDTAPLASVLQAFSNVEAVLCGHVHRAMLRRWAVTVVCTCPSTTTEIALQLRPDASPQSYVGLSAYMLHLWHEAHGLVSHVSHIGTFRGPYPFA